MIQIRFSVAKLNEHSNEKYTLDSRVLNANGFGVPQRRDRAIIVLSRIGRVVWPAPEDEWLRPRAWDALHDLDFASDDVPAAIGKWADLLPSIPEGSNYLHHTARGEGVPLFGYRTRYWTFLLKLAKDRPASTLAAQPGPSTGPFHWTSRPLTVREMLRLQSFPAEWNVEGIRREQVRQVGNATPPALAEAIGRSMVSLLGRSPGAARFAISRLSGTVPDPECIGPVHTRFHHLAGLHDAHPGTGLGPSPRPS